MAMGWRVALNQIKCLLFIYFYFIFSSAESWSFLICLIATPENLIFWSALATAPAETSAQAKVASNSTESCLFVTAQLNLNWSWSLT
jgi:hypothetical protein